MGKDCVDILLATFNGFSFIASQLDSILSQTHKDIHLIVRDDMSSDSTRKILETYAKQYPEKITLLSSEEQLGVKANFSCLMGHSKANYVMFADQDDVWNEGKVAKTLEKMKEIEENFSPDIPLLVHTDLKVVDRDLNIFSDSFWRYNKINPVRGQKFTRLLMQNVVTGCSMMFNKPLLQLAWPIPENAAMHDWWLALVAAAFGKIEALPQATMLYRQHGKNTLGAQKFLSLQYFKKGYAKLGVAETAKQAHAEELLKRFSDRLNPDQIKQLEAFKRLPQADWPNKAFLILRYRFFKMGFIRNLVNILAKKQ